MDQHELEPKMDQFLTKMHKIGPDGTESFGPNGTKGD